MNTEQQVSTDTPAAEPKPERSLWGYLRMGLTWGFVSLVAALGAVTLIVPAVAGATPLAVLTPSMEPTLPVGTLVVVKPTPVQDVRLGDVITYQIKPGDPTLVTHRVVEVRSISTGDIEFLTKGDNNDATDPTVVTAPQLKGKVWYSVPLAGFISMAVGTMLGPIVVPVVGVLLLGYAGYTVISGIVGSKRKKRAAATQPELAPEA
ncbi:signal peptidase I [Lysobacter korlensis]|uniref:Signal peptidase I n=1 Tax=Lysobacter korlensis TaxID=553636 RepID=A0ABV6S2F6_9GAMM